MSPTRIVVTSAHDLAEAYVARVKLEYGVDLPQAALEDLAALLDVALSSVTGLDGKPIRPALHD